jgi:hypothetical protein
MVKRYGFYGKDDFGHHYNALSERDDEYGDWVAFEDYEALADAALYAINQMDLTCMRSNEEISVTEGCPCAFCVLSRLVTPSAKTGNDNG